MNPGYERNNKSINETILIESSFDMSKNNNQKSYKWNETEFPEKWILEGVILPYLIISNKITKIIQRSDGIINIEFEK